MTNPNPNPKSFATLASPILEHMEFARLHLLDVKAVRYPKFDGVNDFTGPISSTDEIHAGWVPETRGAVAIVQLAVQSGEGENQLFEIRADYRVIYRVKDSYTSDDIEERAIAFCKAFALAHAWPYWRELLASLSIRMDLPTINAPLLIVGAQKGAVKKTDIQEAPTT